MASPSEIAPTLPDSKAAVEANPEFSCCYHNPEGVPWQAQAVSVSLSSPVPSPASVADGCCLFLAVRVDPRVCVCGRDQAQCGKKTCVANLGTTGGKLICFLVIALVVGGILVGQMWKWDELPDDEISSGRGR